MSGTALYRALIEAGASQATAKEAAAEIDTLSGDMSEVKLMVRILVALVIAIFLMLLKTMLWLIPAAPGARTASH